MRKSLVLGAGFLLLEIPLLALTLLQAQTWGGAFTDEANEIAFASDGSVYVAIEGLGALASARSAQPAQG